MPSVFISYRRRSESAIARLIRDHLEARLGEGEVFMDVGSIAAGQDFQQVIERQLAESSVVLAVIGPTFTTGRDEHGERLLDNPSDFVVFEIRTALATGCQVIPVLVSGATMPNADELPTTIRSLRARHYAELRHEHFDSDVHALAERIAGRELPRHHRSALMIVRREMLRAMQTFCRVIIDPPRTISTRLEALDALSFAIRFAIYIALIKVLILYVSGYPVEYISGTTVAVGTVLQTTETALLLHLCLRLVGGTARVHQTAASFCFLSAFFIVFAIARIPAAVFVQCLVQTKENWITGVLSIRYERMPPWSLGMFVASGLLLILAWLYFLIAQARVFRVVHRLQTSRTVGAVATATVLAIVLETVFVRPLEPRPYRGVDCTTLTPSDQP